MDRQEGHALAVLLGQIRSWATGALLYLCFSAHGAGAGPNFPSERSKVIQELERLDVAAAESGSRDGAAAVSGCRRRGSRREWPPGLGQPPAVALTEPEPA